MIFHVSSLRQKLPPHFSLPSPLELSAIKTALAMIGKFGITASLSIIYVYSAEVFPTVIR